MWSKDKLGNSNEAIVAAVRSEISATLGVAPHDVALLQRGAPPHTSSGKIARLATKELTARLFDLPTGAGE